MSSLMWPMFGEHRSDECDKLCQGSCLETIEYFGKH